VRLAIGAFLLLLAFLAATSWQKSWLDGQRAQRDEVARGDGTRDGSPPGAPGSAHVRGLGHNSPDGPQTAAPKPWSTVRIGRGATRAASGSSEVSPVDGTTRNP